MKKVLFLFLLAITSVGISGCGSSSESTKSSESTPKQDTRTEIDLVPDQIVTITKEQEGKYIVQKQKVMGQFSDDLAQFVIITVNGKSTGFDHSVTVKEGDQVMATNASTTEVVVKLVPTK